MEKVRAAWEARNERNKVNVRWVLVVVVTLYLSYLLRSGSAGAFAHSGYFNWYYIGSLAGTVSIVNLIVALYLFQVDKGKLAMNPLVKYVTMSLDFVAVSLVLIPTGGDESNFFVVYLIIIVSNAMRYGMKLALIGAFVFNVCYVLVLVYQYWPEESLQGLHREILKIGGVWMVAIYIGYLSRRFEKLQGEVESYEKLVARLSAKSPAQE